MLTKPVIIQTGFNAAFSGQDRCRKPSVIIKCQNNIEQNKSLPKLRFSEDQLAITRSTGKLNMRRGGV